MNLAFSTFRDHCPVSVRPPFHPTACVGTPSDQQIYPKIYTNIFLFLIRVFILLSLSSFSFAMKLVFIEEEREALNIFSVVNYKLWLN